MDYELVFSDSFRKAITKLDKSVRLEVDRALDKIRARPEGGKPLHGVPNLFSERVGSFRIVYLLRGNVIYFVKIGKRKDVYKL
ncbi:type II toxin-antitoxin system RelE/ParE family toxin [Candidatus Micrarchaeota archaeon]|nr:type II toxin-antitoxin system RelE/ParE family toxin [Candidatus Micrarchaeota archaeon]